MEIPKVLPPHLRQLRPGQTAVQHDLVLSDGVVGALRVHPLISAEFAFVRDIKSVPNKTPACKPCSRRAVQRHVEAADLNKIKQQILALPPDRKSRLKSLLNARSLTLFVSTPTGVKKYVV